MVNPAEIQSGEVTHHQDQSITWTNFRTRKTMNNVKAVLPKQQPPEFEFESDILLLLWQFNLEFLGQFSSLDIMLNGRGIVSSSPVPETFSVKFLAIF